MFLSVICWFSGNQVFLVFFWVVARVLLSVLLRIFLMIARTLEMFVRDRVTD